MLLCICSERRAQSFEKQAFARDHDLRKRPCHRTSEQPLFELVMEKFPVTRSERRLPPRRLPRHRIEGRLRLDFTGHDRSSRRIKLVRPSGFPDNYSESEHVISVVFFYTSFIIQIDSGSKNTKCPTPTIRSPQTKSSLRVQLISWHGALQVSWRF
jgi:hypothetical protein